VTPTGAGSPILPALLDSREAYQQRLELILPQSLTGVTYTANPAASAIAFAAIYVGAIDHVRPFRPTTVTWMSDEISGHRDEETRLAYYHAAVSKGGEQAVRDLCAALGIDRGQAWYANNSREPVRDESVGALRDNGAILVLTGIPTNSAKPRYTLEPQFAALLSPDLHGAELTSRIGEWRTTHLTPVARRRAAVQNDPARSPDSVTVQLPDGGVRVLHPGPSSMILKGVIEDFASRLQMPNVLFVSQPGEKVNLLDDHALAGMGLRVDQTLLLPDCLIADLAPGREQFWFIEIVATDGPMTERRKTDLLDWAGKHAIPIDSCRFLTAFASRTASAAKKAIPQLARGSHAWFSDEPDGLLTWDDLNLE
jgi:BsuBI/PstI restriction endonuclease domain/BsuBI/PstI restriction endonuclease HTH domain